MSVQTKIRTFDGNVGIGTNNPGSYKLRVVGGGTRVVNLSVSSLRVANVDGTVPSGVIAMWSGLLADIPIGWKLCDGSNSTPDLRDKFIIGSGTTYNQGQTGGASSTTLTVNNLPSHTHAGTCDAGGSHSHTTNEVSTTGSHGHNINVTSTSGSGGHRHNLSTSTVNHTHAAVDTATSGDHGHNNFNNFNTVNNHQHYGPYLCNQNDVTWYGQAARTNTNSNAPVIVTQFNYQGGFRRAGFTSYANPTHSHTSNSDTVNHLHAMTTNQVLGHQHQSNAASTGAHTHTIDASTQSGTHTHAANNSPSAGNHTHNFTTGSTPATTPTISTIPTYYIIAFIMKE